MLFWSELRKLLLQPIVIGFVLFCMLLNAGLILSIYNADQFDKSIQADNIFIDFQADDIAQGYIQKYSVTNKNARNILKKYEQVQQEIDKKAANGEALSFYFGGQTLYMHSTLFGLFFSVMIAQVSLLGLFLGLFAMTFENISGTEAIVYVSKTGRRVIWTKLYALLTGTLFITAAVIGISLMLFFLRFDFSGAWSDYVSSGFNNAVHEFGKPFISWGSLTVYQYLWATIALTVGLAVCFSLIGYTAGIFVRNSYRSFMIVIIVLGSLFVMKYLLPIGSIYRAVLGITPVWLWKTSGEWFTDGDADIIWRNFETIGVFISLLGLSLLIFIGGKVFGKKEIN